MSFLDDHAVLGEYLTEYERMIRPVVEGLDVEAGDRAQVLFASLEKMYGLTHALAARFDAVESRLLALETAQRNACDPFRNATIDVDFM